MWRRKAAVVAQLLQGLTEPQIASHSRFAAARGFLAGPLGQQAMSRHRPVSCLVVQRLHPAALQHDDTPKKARAESRSHRPPGSEIAG